MNSCSNLLQLRWFNDACYEVKLPNGKHILIDPYIDSSPLKKLGSDVLTQVDYILISHTHFDHVLDLKAITQRFNCQVIVGRQSSLELAKRYDLAGHEVFPCDIGYIYHFDGFTLQGFPGKHTSIGEIDRPSRWPSNVKNEGLDPSTTLLNMLGSYEYMIYLLEFPNHIRFLVWGGGATEQAVRQAHDFRSNISIAQLPRESPHQIASLYAAIGGQVIFPHHHDSFLAKGPEGQAVIDAVVEQTNELAPSTKIICPEKGKWYTFTAGISSEE